MKDDANLTPAVEKKDDTGKILGRLVGYMAGGEARGRFIIALILRVLGLIGLILLPTFTGRAINEASNPNGSVSDLLPDPKLVSRAYFLRFGNQGPLQAADSSF